MSSAKKELIDSHFSEDLIFVIKKIILFKIFQI